MTRQAAMSHPETALRIAMKSSILFHPVSHQGTISLSDCGLGKMIAIGAMLTAPEISTERWLSSGNRISTRGDRSSVLRSQNATIKKSAIYEAMVRRWLGD
jgi:hypothetical protein